MIQEQKNTKKYLLTITVDEEQLIKSYTGNNESINREELPNTDELILFECGWLSSSGIHVKDIQEVEE